MASETSNSNGFLYFIVGALFIAVIGLGIFAYTGGFQSPTDRAIESSANAVGDAARDVSNAVPNSN